MVKNETMITKAELELSTERERKFLCRCSFDQLSILLGNEANWGSKQNIEQIYLSHPNEEWSLRVRKTTSGSSDPEYTVTLKSSDDNQGEEALERVEVEAPISEEIFRFFQQQEQLPRLQKYRHLASIDCGIPGISVDTIDGIDTLLIEVENPEQHPELIERCTEEERIKEVTHDTTWQNEYIAHQIFKAEYGCEALTPKDPLNVVKICHDIVRHRVEKSTVNPTIISLRGRSGSGKTTFAHELQQALTGHGMSSAIVTTDDYNRGITALNQLLGHEEWRGNWDEHMIYDTALLAQELEACITHGEPIPQRSFDFITEEPQLTGEYYPKSQIVIVEGIFAHSSNITPLLALQYEMTTPLATCIGRRLIRDLSTRKNSEFQDPAELLRYQLEVAERMYQKYSL